MLNLPKRSPDTVPVLVDGPYAAGLRHWQIAPPVDTLTLIVKGTYALRDGALVEPVEPMMLSGDIPFDEENPASPARYPSDFAPYKPCADVLLVGHAVAVGGEQEVVRVEFGLDRMLRRSLVAMGPRRWEHGVPSAPLPFDRQPLCWPAAFGGESYEDNPLGCGLAGLALPRLEDPAQLLRRSSDRVPPACFAPIPDGWKARSKHLGTYDRRWQQERWPWFPEDFDYAYFNVAPLPQRVPFLRGNEEVFLAGTSAEVPKLATQLSGVVPRALAQYGREQGFRSAEVPLNLDTLWIDADAQTVVLVWRGVITVSSEQAPELAMLYVAADALAAPTSLEVLRDRLAAKLTPEEEDTSLEALGRRRVPAARRSKRGPRVALPKPTSAVVDVASLAPDLAGANLLGQNLEGADLQGRSLRGALLSRCNLKGANLRGADLTDAVLSEVSAAGACFAEAKMDGCNLSDADLEGADLQGASLAEALLPSVRLTKAKLAGANCSHARITQAVLDSVDASDANLAGADLSDSSLHGAVFARATLTEVRLYECIGKDILFTGALLRGLRADSASLTGCAASGVDATGAGLTGANLSGAQLEGAKLDGAVLTRANFEDANLAAASLKQAQLQHGKLARASLQRANLLQAQLEGADLADADLRGANLYEAETWRARVLGAKLEGALLMKTKLAPKA